ncbi:MAG: hypothetical protein Q9170_008056 [Blastenia crenularia]
MALQVLPYSVEHYNSLPELEDAKKHSDSANVPDILYTEIGAVFIRHHVETTLGMILLHNHFFLEPNEMLVAFQSTAYPWDTTSGATQLSGVNATAWRFTDSGLAPYEFAYTPVAVPFDHHPMPSFLLELAAVLKKWNLTNIFGLCSLGEVSVGTPKAMEFTEGRANITYPFDIRPNEGSAVDAMWQFSSDPLNSSSQALSERQGD